MKQGNFELVTQKVKCFAAHCLPSCLNICELALFKHTQNSASGTEKYTYYVTTCFSFLPLLITFKIKDYYVPLQLLAYILQLCWHPKRTILSVCLSSCLSRTFAISARLPLWELRKVSSKSILFPSCLGRQFPAMHKSLQSTVWVASFSSITLFPLWMIYPTMLLFLQLDSYSCNDYNLIYTLKVKNCHENSAKYFKNPKASVCACFFLHMIPYFIPEKSHILLYSLPSRQLSGLGWVFSLFSSIAGYNRFQRSLLSSASSSRPCVTAVGPEARKQKKLCSFLNHRDLSQESDEDLLFQEQNKEKQPFWS